MFNVKFFEPPYIANKSLQFLYNILYSLTFGKKNYIWLKGEMVNNKIQWCNLNSSPHIIWFISQSNGTLNYNQSKFAFQLLNEPIEIHIDKFGLTLRQ